MGTLLYKDLGPHGKTKKIKMPKTNNSSADTLNFSGRNFCFTVHKETKDGANPDFDWAPKEHKDIRYLVMQLERGEETGKLHWQGYMETNKYMRAKAVKELLGAKTAHLEPRRGSQQEAIAYSRKVKTRVEGDSNLVEIGEPGKDGRPSKEKKQSGFYQVVNQDLPEAEMKKILMENHPRDVALYGRRLINNIMDFKGTKVKINDFRPPYKLSDYKIPFEIQYWIDNEFTKKTRPKCLYICGPTRIGKSMMVRHILPDSHMFFSGDFNIDYWDEDAKIIIFDDVAFTDIPKRRQLLTGMQQPFTISDKYRQKRRVNGGKACIICENYLPEIPKMEQRYWEMNMTIVQLPD